MIAARKRKPPPPTPLAMCLPPPLAPICLTNLYEEMGFKLG